MSNPPNHTPHKTSKRIKALLAILGAVVLGTIGNGVWELIARPGLTRFGRFILGVVTLGSQSAKDAAYSTAAIDPNPVASLFMLLLLSLIPLLLAITFVAIVVGFAIIRRRLPPRFRLTRSQEIPESQIKKEDAEKLEQQYDERRRKTRRRLRIASVVFVGYLLVVFLVGQIGLLILNQSVVIWRVFHANLAICTPYLSDSEEKNFRARFASMQTKADYERIDKELREVASKNAVALLPYELW